jgi:nucleotide-binding universal stress UspA family protein
MKPNTTYDERIVCGVDDSSAAANVLAVATQLADALGLRLTLVHSPYPDVFLAGEERRAALSRGEALLDRLAPEVPAADRIVEIGDPAKLLRAVLDDGAALGVVGSRGRGAARAALLGSVSHALARSAPCPLIVVPPHATLNAAAGSAVVCGVDGSVEAAAALQVSGAVADALAGRLVAVYVRRPTGTTSVPAAWAADRWQVPVEEGRAALAIVERALAQLDLNIPLSLCVESGDPAERLSAVAGAQRSAILAVGSRGLGAVRAAMLGSVSSRLGAIALSPVLIMPRAARPPDLVARPRTKLERARDSRRRRAGTRRRRDRLSSNRGAPALRPHAP